MVAIHFAGFGAKPGSEAQLMAGLEEFKAAFEKENMPGYNKIWVGTVKYNAERAKPYTHVLYMEFDNQDRIFKDYGGDTKGGKMHGEYGAKLRDHYQELLVADFEAPRRAEKLVHVVCFDVAEGKEGLWEDGAEILRKAGKGADGVLPVTLLHGGKLVGTWNRGLNRVLLTEFESKADLDVYGPHPEHQKAAMQYLVPASVPGGVKVFDFEV